MRLQCTVGKRGVKDLLFVRRSYKPVLLQYPVEHRVSKRGALGLSHIQPICAYCTASAHVATVTHPTCAALAPLVHCCAGKVPTAARFRYSDAGVIHFCAENLDYYILLYFIIF